MDKPRKFNRQEMARVKDAAAARAHRLRQEAIDDFWRGANDILSTAAVQSYRSAQRLAARLKRRAMRAEPSTDTASTD